jgi:putative endonuclease
MAPPLMPRTAISPPGPKRLWRQRLGRKAYRQGHGAEWMAALYLMLKGYQILAFRLKTKGGEIDILARKGPSLIVVEVKRRLTRDDALLAVTQDQYARLLRAGQSVQRSRPSLLRLDLRIDLLALAPMRWPHHLKGLLSMREAYDA